MTSGRSPRTALITGGASGFGLATAAAMLECGDRVTIGDVDGRQLAAARDRLLDDRPVDDRLHALELDVTRAVSVRQAV